MIEFIQNNWKDVVEIIISLITGFAGGYTFKSIKIKSKISGNNNIVLQNVEEKNNE